MFSTTADQCLLFLLIVVGIAAGYLTHMLVHCVPAYANNTSIALYKHQYLSLTRVDNTHLLNWWPTAWRKAVKIGVLRVHPDYNNQITLKINNHDPPHILNLPQLPGMHPRLPPTQQYEDPRVFVVPQENRVFFTATVFTDDNQRMALIELHPDSWEFKQGHVLHSDSPHRQKNWVLFTGSSADTVKAEKTYILTDVHPQICVSEIDLDSGTLQPLPPTDSTAAFASLSAQNVHIRCGTTAVPFGPETLLCAVHTCTKDARWPYYRTAFVELTDRPPFRVLRVGKLATFNKNKTRVEFPAGLCWNKDHTALRLSLGVADKRNTIVDVIPDVIF